MSHNWSDFSEENSIKLTIKVPLKRVKLSGHKGLLTT